MVAKDGDKVIGFVVYGEHRDDVLTDCGEVSAITVLASEGRLCTDERSF